LKWQAAIGLGALLGLIARVGFVSLVALSPRRAEGRGRIMVRKHESIGNGSVNLTKRAWVAFGAYLLSLFVAFELGLWARINVGFPIGDLLFGPPARDTSVRYLLLLLGVSWLANPIVLIGIFMLRVGARGGAAIAGAAAIAFSLCALPNAFLHPLIIPAYVVWVTSMVLLIHGALRECRPADTERALPKEKFDELSKPHGSVNKKCACVAFGVYVVSCWLPPFVLTFPPRGQVPRSDLVLVVPLLLWLANPIIVLGMFMLGVGARRGAAIAGTVAIVFALTAIPISFVLLDPSYFLWLTSMVLVVYGAFEGGGPAEAEPPVRKQKLDELLDRYEEET
jgi:hypothetical protein